MSKAKDRIPRVEQVKEEAEKKKNQPKIGRLAGIFFFIAMIILVCYAFAMTGDYVFNDAINFRALRNASDSNEFWLNMIATGLSSPLSLSWLKSTYAWDLNSFGSMAGWSHAVNIVLHLFTCFYLYLFVFRISWRLFEEKRSSLNPYYVAAATTALFACHPLVSGSIGYISGRPGVLGGANFFLALDCFLYAYFEDRLEWAFAGYTLFFLFSAMGFGSNLECYSLPFIAIVTALILKPLDQSWREWWAERCYEIGLLFSVGCVALWLLTFPLPMQVDNGFGLVPLAPSIYWATQLKLLFTYYLRCALVPFGMSVSPPYAISSGWTDPLTICGGLVLLGMAAGGWVVKNLRVTLAMAIFLLTLFPWSVLPQPEYVSDYRFYLPLAGLCMVAGLPLAYAAGLNVRKTLICSGGLALLLISLTVLRTVEWSTEKRLWRVEVKRNPDDARLHAYLARFYAFENKETETKNEFNKARKIDAHDFTTNAEEGLFLYKQRLFYQSSQSLTEAITIGKKLGLAESQLARYYTELAHDYYEMGNTKKSFENAEIAFKYIKGDSFLYLARGTYQLKNNQAFQALKTFEDGYKRDNTNPEFLEPIAEAALDTKIPQLLHAGYIAARKALQIRHTQTANKLFIRACLELGKTDEAKQALDKVKFTEEPRSPEIIYLWSVLHKLTGKTELAEKERKEALSMAPDVENRFHLQLKIKPGEKEPEPEIKPKGVAEPVPDIQKIDPKIQSIYKPSATNDGPKPATPQPASPQSR